MRHELADTRKERPIIPNKLALRYASTPMLHLFSPRQEIVDARRFWVIMMKAQERQGLVFPPGVIDAYEAVIHDVDLDSIDARDRVLRHDQKAQIEEFSALAKARLCADTLNSSEVIHLGLTSRDKSDNLEQAQNKRALCLIRERAVATLARLSHLALQYSAQVYADRSHLAVAQPSILGKLFATSGEELLIAFNGLESLIDSYRLRGIKGATGTQADMLQLLGDQSKVDALEKEIAHYLGFEHVFNSTGQIYPRSLDVDLVATLFQTVCGPASLASTLRQMAGQEQFTEGFKEGQVGSTAMPHKMNSRTCERIKSLKGVLAGNLTMVTSIAGEQKYAGDVECSALRRVALADAFFATDGIFQAMLTVLEECGFYPSIIDREVEKYLPFLTTTRLLMMATQKGMGREMAHKIIKRHAVNVAVGLRRGEITENDLLKRLAADENFVLDMDDLHAALARPIEFVGNAQPQITQFVKSVAEVVQKYPDEALYTPETIV